MNELILFGDLGVGGQRGRIFQTNGIIAAMSATDYKDPQKVMIRKKANVDNRWRTEKSEYKR